MSFEPVQVSAPDGAEPGPLAPPLRAVSRRIRRPGPIALVLAMLAVGLECVAIVTGSGGAWGAATVLAWFSIAFFALSFALGIVAAISGLGRAPGLAAIILSVLVNPLTLVGIFSMLGSTA
ncbi:hypothetical protein F1C58_01410 [Glaciihabitans sp. INWT7]|uniref:hypothetical protein n=1 Tax=Glaciihabitans sp. INWT7 TaxID=2596912 RepID=UPI001624E65C|nr:hypothetical protein [Glaciihabitans sp. INWT7]QNE45707.1 hypothetical protein F1C58_01410 [Glaciihabitans sp. INWT7]